MFSLRSSFLRARRIRKTWLLRFPIPPSAPSVRQFVHTYRHYTSHQVTASKTKEINTETSQKEVQGKSGCRYRIEKTLQRGVYLATSKNKPFVLKLVDQSDFEYFQDLYARLDGCSHVRLLHDTISNPSMFVYQHFSEDLLSLVRRDLPIKATKRILKDALRGLAALHEKHILHADVKANNIMIDYENGPNNTIVIKKVQLTDIESGVYAPPPGAIHGIQPGNIMWRSPEAHAKGPIQTPSDIFSFAIVCMYAVHKRLLFAVNKEDSLPDGENPVFNVVEKQMSYFATPASLDSFLAQLEEDNPWRQNFKDIRSRFGDHNPRKPVSMWTDIDPDFQDLLGGLAHFDPKNRLTAHEALAHKWFAGV